MFVKKKESVSGEWAKKGEDIRGGEVIKLVDSGREIEGQFGTQNVFSAMTKNGAKNITLNQTSLNAWVDEMGEDTDKWVGQPMMVHAIKQNVQGKFTDVYYFTPLGYEMGEYGFEKVGNQGGYAWDKKSSEEMPPF